MILACIFKLGDDSGLAYEIRVVPDDPRIKTRRSVTLATYLMEQLEVEMYEPLGALEVFRTTSAPERKHFEDVEPYVVAWFKKEGRNERHGRNPAT